MYRSSSKGTAAYSRNSVNQAQRLVVPRDQVIAQLCQHNMLGLYCQRAMHSVLLLVSQLVAVANVNQTL